MLILIQYKQYLISLQKLKQPQNSTSYILPTGTAETLCYIRKVIREAVKPSWVDSVPKNFGDAKAGTIKAGEWRTLSTIFLPIALVILWGDFNSCYPPDDQSAFLLKALDHTMALFQATILACKHTMTPSRAMAYRKYISIWVENLAVLFPHAREGKGRPNIHAAGHIYDFLLLFGPVMSWWCFPFERMIGALQKINTNDHIGGMFLCSCAQPIGFGIECISGVMESTIIKTVARMSNIRRWLRRPECPEAVQQLKVLFDKSFVPANATDEDDTLRPMKGPHRAYVKLDGVNFSPSATHAGNATIIYRATTGGQPIGGQIQQIQNKTTQHGLTIQVHVRPYEPLPSSSFDPFRRYPHLLATTYSSSLRREEDVISLDDIIAHAARFDYSLNRTVLVNLSRD